MISLENIYMRCIILKHYPDHGVKISSMKKLISSQFALKWQDCGIWTALVFIFHGTRVMHSCRSSYSFWVFACVKLVDGSIFSMVFLMEILE